MKMVLEKLKKAFTRKKILTDINTSNENKKCLSTVDLVFLGLSQVGGRVYGVSGRVVLMAGPAAFLSFFIAIGSASLSAFSYAELGGRIPKTGSAYLYNYISIGELCAFIIGWSLIQEYILAASSVASMISVFIDLLSNHQISLHLTQYLPLPSFHLFNTYPDLVALAFVLVSTVILCFGIKKINLLNNILVIINIILLLIFFLYAALQFNLSYGTLKQDSIPKPERNGDGGFVAHGVMGVLRGVSVAFFTCVSFRTITNKAEETKDPIKCVPRAVISVILISIISYILIVSMLCLVQPYYMNTPNDALSVVFIHLGHPVVSVLATVLALLTLISSLMPLLGDASKIICNMAGDGLLYDCLARFNTRFQSPIPSTILTGILTGLLTTFMKLKDLVDMFSIASLLVYTLVNYCVLLLRYQHCPQTEESITEETEDSITEQTEDSITEETQKSITEETKPANDNNDLNWTKLLHSDATIHATSYGTNNNEGNMKSRENLVSETSGNKDGDEKENKDLNEKKNNWLTTFKSVFKDLFSPNLTKPTQRSERIFQGCIVSTVVVTLIGNIIIFQLENYINDWEIVGIVVISKCFGFLCLLIIQAQPQVPPDCNFKVPFVPYLPMLAIVINIHLITLIHWRNCLRILLWMAKGLLIYFCYGIRNSHLNKQKSTYSNLEEEEEATQTDEFTEL